MTEPARKAPRLPGAKPAKGGRARGGGAATSPRVLKAKIRAADALETRLTGVSWREIARLHGYASGGHAYDEVMGCLRSMPPMPRREELRTIMDLTIDEVLATAWPRFKAGELEAGRVILRALDRRAKLLGLDAITDAEYVAIESVQGLLNALFDAAMRLLEPDKHAAFLEDARRTIKLLDPPAA